MVRSNFPFSPSYPPRRPPPYYYQAPPPYPHVQTQYLGHSNEIYTNHVEDQYLQNDPYDSSNNVLIEEPYHHEEESSKYELETIFMGHL